MRPYFLVLFIYILSSFNAFAEPSPFGLKIKKTTYEEVKQKYSGTDAGTNQYSKGRMYDINCSKIDIEGLKTIRTIFDQNDILIGVLTSFEKHRYNTLLESLSQKYKLITKQDAFVGNKEAKFFDHNTHIFIASPHMSFEVKIAYMHDELEKEFSKQSDQEEKEKKQKEFDSL